MPEAYGAIRRKEGAIEGDTAGDALLVIRAQHPIVRDITIR